MSFHWLVPMEDLEKGAEVGEHDGAQGLAETLEVSCGDFAYQRLAPQIWFKLAVFISCASAMLDSVLIAFPSTLIVQYIVLAISSGCFLLIQIAVIAAMPSFRILQEWKAKHSDQEEMPPAVALRAEMLEDADLSLEHLDQSTGKLPLWRRIRLAMLGEVWFELFFLILGWIQIVRDPSMAVFRCLRVLRNVWYSEFYSANEGDLLYPVTFISHLILQYLEKLGSELFTLKSRGGPVVLGFFLFWSYIFGVAYWQKTSQWALTSPEGGPTGTVSECDTLAHCFFIMMRLAFFDGSGFDFVKSLIDYPDNGLTALLLLYMAVAAFVLLNGLIGIFGEAFNAATTENEDSEAQIQMNRIEEKLANLEKLLNKLGAAPAQ